MNLRSNCSMEEWKEYSLGEITSLVIDYRGKTPLKLGGNWSPTGYRALSAKNIKTGEIVNEESIRFVNEELYRKWMKDEVQRGDIFITSEAPFGQIYYWDSDEKIVLSQRLFCLRIKELVHSKYVYYYMTTDRFQHELDGRATGTTVVGLRQPELLKCRIQMPSLAEQRRIASILSSLDDKIELNRKINANLEAQAQALFKSWFVDFEPFKDQPFVESELGMIPQGWKVGTFLDNVNVMPGGTPSTNKTEYWTDGTIPFFSPKDVNGVYCFKTEKNITELGLNNCSSHLYPKDTLFITARGTVGKLALAGLPMAMNQSNYALVAKEGISKFYLYLLAQTLVSVLLKKANGAVFSAITTRDFNEPTIIPPTLDIKHFDNLVSPIFNKIYQTEQESRRLASLRDALLPRLMSGELKVNEIVL